MSDNHKFAHIRDAVRAGRGRVSQIDILRIHQRIEGNTMQDRHSSTLEAIIADARERRSVESICGRLGTVAFDCVAYGNDDGAQTCADAVNEIRRLVGLIARNYHGYCIDCGAEPGCNIDCHTCVAVSKHRHGPKAVVPVTYRNAEPAPDEHKVDPYLYRYLLGVAHGQKEAAEKLKIVAPDGYVAMQKATVELLDDATDKEAAAEAFNPDRTKR